MSAPVPPATDAQIAWWKHDLARGNEIPFSREFDLSIIARIEAGDARFESFEKTGLALLRDRNTRIEALEAADAAFRAAIIEAAYAAWPHAEDVGSDAPHIIAELASERDAAEARIKTLVRQVVDEVHPQRSSPGGGEYEHGFNACREAILKILLSGEAGK